MRTIIFSFLTGNKSRPKTKCNLTFIPGFFQHYFFYSLWEYIPEKKTCIIKQYEERDRDEAPRRAPPLTALLVRTWPSRVLKARCMALQRRRTARVARMAWCLRRSMADLYHTLGGGGRQLSAVHSSSQCQ